MVHLAVRNVRWIADYASKPLLLNRSIPLSMLQLHRPANNAVYSMHLLICGDTVRTPILSHNSMAHTCYSLSEPARQPSSLLPYSCATCRRCTTLSWLVRLDYQPKVQDATSEKLTITLPARFSLSTLSWAHASAAELLSTAYTCTAAIWNSYVNI